MFKRRRSIRVGHQPQDRQALGSNAAKWQTATAADRQATTEQRRGFVMSCPMSLIGSKADVT